MSKCAGNCCSSWLLHAFKMSVGSQSLSADQDTMLVSTSKEKTRGLNIFLSAFSKSQLCCAKDRKVG